MPSLLPARALAPALSLLLLLDGVLLPSSDAQSPPAVRSRARYLFPEDTRPQHALVAAQLESLGFTKADAVDDAATDRWQSLSRSSNQVDLVWTTAAAPPLAQLDFPSIFTTKVNQLPGAADRLATASALAEHVAAQQKKHGKYFFHYTPAYFSLPRDSAKLARAIADSPKKAELDPRKRRDWYIYQRFQLREVPADSDEASATKAASAVFTKDADLDVLLDSPSFRDKTVEAREYIEPFLIDNRKFRVGFYVAVAGVDPLRVYVYNHPKIQIARADYPQQLEANADPATYLLNDDALAPWDYAPLQPLFLEFPSANRPGTNAWHVVQYYLRRQGIDTRQVSTEVHDAIVRTIASNRSFFQQQIAQLKRSKPDGASDETPSDLSDNFFGLFKFDFELDITAKPWLVDVHTNPSLVPRQSAFGTDEAVLKGLVGDLFRLVGAHPQAKLPFDQFFRPTGAAFCTAKCHDKTRAWDAACWSCPGWFPPYIARRLFDASTEYARRGQFDLVFPALDRDVSKFLDSPLSEHDVALDRYLQSLSASYAEPRDEPVGDRKVVCIYRDHCSNHGDCVNGACRCDSAYEGNTCYIPKDPDAADAEQHEQLAADRAAHGAREAETWKEKVEHFMWKHGAPGTTGPEVDGGQLAEDHRPQVAREAESFSGGKLLFALAVLTAFVLGAYRAFMTFAPPSVTRDHGAKSS